MDLKKRFKREGGFTLIELVAVIIILGILAAVIVPKYFDMASQARTAALKGAVNEAQARFNMAYAQYVVETGIKPTTVANLTNATLLGTSATAVNMGDYSAGYALAGSTLTVTVTNSATSATTSMTTAWPN